MEQESKSMNQNVDIYNIQNETDNCTCFKY